MGEMIDSGLNKGSVCPDNLLTLTTGIGENDRDRSKEE